MQAPYPDTMIPIDCCDRWQVYFRLQELDIPCHCQSHQPLQVKITTPQAALQVWTVVRRCSTPRPDLAQWLDGCWHLPAPL
ncbi:Asr1405/Asl0597 family protein [Leptolyngbya sp. PCC 6406]|uniref:Asr1405/Asl0597 family protein n=1 Tax=Leptolyngbya sp. PCC 6406 TaxID=1173264 RepID=UPI0002FD3CF8|nr:Asr1405/Asl0597 family protein [Leptolyngbya sp. PCC 6406]